MALCREKIEYGEIRNFFSRKHDRHRVYLKKCMNRWIRRKSKKIDEDSIADIPKEYNGWEF